MLFGVNVIQGYIIPFSCSVSRVMFPVCGTVRGWESVNTLLATQSVESSFACAIMSPWRSTWTNSDWFRGSKTCNVCL